MKLEGKVALITGAASGIGKAGALLFAREGAKVAIADINDASGSEVVAEAKEFGGDIHYIHADIGDMTSVEKMVQESVQHYGKLNIFWHNAGIAGPSIIERTSEDDFDRMFATHVKAGFFGTKYSVPEMKKIGGGVVLFTGSAAGLRPPKISPVYGMAKASLIMLTRSLALHYAKENIRVNCLCPGLVQTPMEPIFYNRDPDLISPDLLRKKYLEAVPVGRLGRPEEIAQMALFLASEDASYMTGSIVTVDGGFTAS